MGQVPEIKLMMRIGCLHDPANVQQTSSKCIQNIKRELLDVCQKLVGRLLPYIIMELDVCWKFAGRLLDRVNTP